MIYQQTDYQGFHIGTNAEPVAGAIDTAAPDYNPATHRARWVSNAWDIRTKEAWDLILNPPPPVLTDAEVLQAKREAATLTPMQFMLNVNAAGMMPAIEDYLALTTTPINFKIMWNKAQVFERLYPDLVAAATDLGITDAEMDAVFGIV